MKMNTMRVAAYRAAAQTPANVAADSSAAANPSLPAANTENKIEIPKTSGGCGPDVDNQPSTCGLEAGSMRAQPGLEANPVRSDANHPDADSDEPPMSPERKRMQLTFASYFLEGMAKKLFLESDSPDWIGDVRARMDPRSPLDQLPIEKQRLLYEALAEFGSNRVLDYVNLPEPDGLGIKTSLSSLKRFSERFEKRTQQQKEAELAEIVGAATTPSASDQDIARVSERLLRMRLLESVNNPASKSAEIRDLYQTLTRLRAQEIAEKRLALAERKLET